MDAMLSELIIAITTAVIGYVIGIFKDRQYNLKMEDLYSKYKMFFTVSGVLLKQVDEKLYHEVEEAIQKMQMAYQSESFTTKAFNEIVLECKDVFDRAQYLIKNRS
jgi:hypothetical protein